MPVSPGLNGFLGLPSNTDIPSGAAFWVGAAAADAQMKAGTSSPSSYSPSYSSSSPSFFGWLFGSSERERQSAEEELERARAESRRLERQQREQREWQHYLKMEAAQNRKLQIAQQERERREELARQQKAAQHEANVIIVKESIWICSEIIRFVEDCFCHNGKYSHAAAMMNSDPRLRQLSEQERCNIAYYKMSFVSDPEVQNWVIRVQTDAVNFFGNGPAIEEWIDWVNEAIENINNAPQRQPYCPALELINSRNPSKSYQCHTAKLICGSSKSIPERPHTRCPTARALDLMLRQPG